MIAPSLAYDASAEPLEEPANDEVMSLEDIAASDINLAERLDDTTTSQIVRRCLDGYERDDASRKDWVAGFDRGMELVRLVSKDRDLWFNRAADVHDPLIATACIQFNARAYPAIINGPQIVKAQVEGDDPDGLKAARALRVSEHMSYQLLTEMPEWETDTDKLLLHLPAAGMAFRSYTWDAVNGRPKSEFISARKFVVNQEASDLKTVPLFTIEFDAYPHTIRENQLSGAWRDIELSLDKPEEAQKQDMLRCHVRFDLDLDGYDEPYIATIHKKGEKLLSLRPDFWPQDVKRDEGGQLLRVDRRSLVVAYGFIPDPEGRFYWMGFGQLLLSYNESIDALTNQLIDAGTLQNLGGGFVGQGVKLPGGRLEFEFGEWKQINAAGNDIRAAIVPFPTPQPSAVTLQMRGDIRQQAEKLTSISDALTGDAPANQPATTTLSNVEQASMVITAINKRVFRAVGEECEILYALNGAFLPDKAYYRWADSQRAVARNDYATGDMDIKPVADPSMASAPQRMAQAQFLQQQASGPFSALYDPALVNERVMELARIPDWKALLKKQTGPDPQQALAAELAASGVAKAHADVDKTKAETDGKRADTLLKEATAAAQLAQAEAVKLENEAARRLLAAEDVGAVAGAAAAENLHAFEETLAQSGSMGGLAGTPDDAPGVPGAVPAGGIPQGGLAGAGMDGGPSGPADMGGTPGPLTGVGGPGGPDGGQSNGDGGQQ